MNRFPDCTCLSPLLESWDQVIPTSRASAEIRHVRDKIVTGRHKQTRSAVCLATSSRHNTYIYQAYQTRPSLREVDVLLGKVEAYPFHRDASEQVYVLPADSERIVDLHTYRSVD